MRVGLMGLGRIGRFHAGTLSRLAGELIVADADRRLAEEVAAETGAVVGDPWSADAVVIATPTSTHAELLLRACEQRIPVFCEKPAAPGVAETQRVAEAADRSGTLVHIGFQRRFDPGFAAARQALLGGELGELHRVHLLTGDPRPPAPEYVPLSGGIFRDCHIHDFDILRWVTGREAETVYAAGANRGEAFFAAAGDVDTSAALITMADGTLVTLQGSRYNGAGYDVRMELAGTRATWAVGLGPRTPLHRADASADEGADGRAASGADDGASSEGPWPDFQARFAAAYTAEIEAFLAAARGERGSPCTVGDALAALHLAEAADLSRREGRPVQLAEVTK
ncbi:Gfo/Idh/MocA family oxidoreductase [Nonomuraea sp. FMUSA5-5]|uniref:Gfo/Idh/MocA family oxidoreductase n=1 Tax=Nonomuraea composti TaxID=2720023 RepID=A0ABX1BR07_9ACTN|nr:Gfo/Idh/MocA family oxidoreductase [Nonomuraea sp. FMUSA5-5]NJP98682.1 Gfo/Idh/MocA family oxidoreductase [Nonomuraea sp. FMUSA5-5]